MTDCVDEALKTFLILYGRIERSARRLKRQKDINALEEIDSTHLQLLTHFRLRNTS